MLLVCGNHEVNALKVYGILLVSENHKVNTHKLYSALLVCVIICSHFTNLQIYIPKLYGNLFEYNFQKVFTL
jgi:hypothetical protein